MYVVVPLLCAFFRISSQGWIYMQIQSLYKLILIQKKDTAQLYYAVCVFVRSCPVFSYAPRAALILDYSIYMFLKGQNIIPDDKELIQEIYKRSHHIQHNDYNMPTMIASIFAFGQLFIYVETSLRTNVVICKVAVNLLFLFVVWPVLLILVAYKYFIVYFLNFYQYLFSIQHFHHVITCMRRPQGRGFELARKHIASCVSELECILKLAVFIRSNRVCGSNEDGIDDRTTASGRQPIGFDPSLNSRLCAPTPPRAIKILSWKKVRVYKLNTHSFIHIFSQR